MQPNINIFRLPKSQDPQILRDQVRHQVGPLREIRLETLQSDPQNFFSRYEDEKDKPLDFFIDRIFPRHVQHFVAVQEDIVESAVKYFGYLVFINEWLEDRDETERVDRGEEVCTFYLAVIAVDAALRGQRIGSRMIEAALQYARGEMQECGFRRARVRLGVMSGNDRAVRLYQRHGFVVDDPQRVEEMESENETTMSLLLE